MATCKDCIHTDVCRLPFNTSETKVEFAHVCHHFKNKADSVEVKHGEWVSDEDNDFYCSVCKKYPPLMKESEFCPKCGADMDG